MRLNGHCVTFMKLPYYGYYFRPWIQNEDERRGNGLIKKALELGELRFHAAIATIWSAIAVLE